MVTLEDLHCCALKQRSMKIKAGVHKHRCFCFNNNNNNNNNNIIKAASSDERVRRSYMSGCGAVGLHPPLLLACQNGEETSSKRHVNSIMFV